MKTRWLIPCLVILVASGPARGSDWLPPEPARLSVTAAEGGRWRVESALGGFTLTSSQSLDATE